MKLTSYSNKITQDIKISICRLVTMQTLQTDKNISDVEEAFLNACKSGDSGFVIDCVESGVDVNICQG